MPEDFTGDGRCPYCNEQFHGEHLKSACQAVACNHCGRWFVVKTHVTYSTHRVEGEAAKPYPLRIYAA